MDDRLRQAAREVYRDPQLFLQQLDEATRLRLFSAMTWQQLLDLVGSLQLDKKQLQQLTRVIGEMHSEKYYTIQEVDIRSCTDAELLELFRLVRLHGIVPPASQVPAMKHYLVRNQLYRRGLMADPWGSL